VAPGGRRRRSTGATGLVGIVTKQVARMKRLIDDLLSLRWVELTDHQMPSDAVGVARPEGPIQQNGFGLGLALVRQLVSQHCGRLPIDSEEGKGTTVSVSLRGTTRMVDAGWRVGRSLRRRHGKRLPFGAPPFRAFASTPDIFGKPTFLPSHSHLSDRKKWLCAFRSAEGYAA